MNDDWIPSDGLRFECTSCGMCCTGPPGFVGYDHDEAHALARRLGLTLEAFEASYTRKTLAGRSLNEIETEHGYDCVFLDRDAVPGQAVCSVYEDRPAQCRSFPWWPEHLQDRDAWNRLGRDCEGVGRGAFVPVEEIMVNAQRQTAIDRSRRP